MGVSRTARTFVDTVGRKWNLTRIEGLGYMCEDPDCGRLARLRLQFEYTVRHLCRTHLNNVTPLAAAEFDPVHQSAMSNFGSHPPSAIVQGTTLK